MRERVRGGVSFLLSLPSCASEVHPYGSFVVDGFASCLHIMSLSQYVIISIIPSYHDQYVDSLVIQCSCTV